MKTWLDDTNPPPDLTWNFVNTYDECIFLLRTGSMHERNRTEVISLDYDLSRTDPHHTGMDVLDYLAEQVLNGFKIPEIDIHSSHSKAIEMSRKADALNSMMKRLK